MAHRGQGFVERTEMRLSTCLVVCLGRMSPRLNKKHAEDPIDNNSLSFVFCSPQNSCVFAASCRFSEREETKRVKDTKRFLQNTTVDEKASLGNPEQEQKH